MDAIAIDYRLAFNMAPVGLVLSRNRAIMDCNEQLCEMFGASREVLTGQSFRCSTRAPMNMSGWARA